MSVRAVRGDNEHIPCVIVGGGTAWCIGNGQVHDAVQMEKERCKTLNCMVDPMKILVVKGERVSNANETDRNDSRPSDTEDK